MKEELFSSDDLPIQATYWQYFKSSTGNDVNLVYATAFNTTTTEILADIMVASFWEGEKLLLA